MFLRYSQPFAGRKMVNRRSVVSRSGQSALAVRRASVCRAASQFGRRDTEAAVNDAAEMRLARKPPTESDFPGTAMVQAGIDEVLVSFADSLRPDVGA